MGQPLQLNHIPAPKPSSIQISSTLHLQSQRDPTETLAAASAAKGYSSHHFGAIVLLGAKELRIGLPSRIASPGKEGVQRQLVLASLTAQS